MSSAPNQPESPIVIVPYNPRWPDIYQAERAAIVGATGSLFIAIEHIGSTSIPGLAAKPIIDMMASVTDLESAYAQANRLAAVGYVDEHTDMQHRILFGKRVPERGYSVHLHVVTADTWDTRNERLLCDYLRRHSRWHRHMGSSSSG